MAPKTFTGKLSSSVNLILTPYFITSSVCIPLESWPRCVLHHFFSSSTGSILGSCYASFSLILNPWLVAASMTLTECSPCWSYRTHLWYCNPVLGTRGERPLQAQGFVGGGDKGQWEVGPLTSIFPASSRTLYAVPIMDRTSRYLVCSQRTYLMALTSIPRSPLCSICTG